MDGERLSYRDVREYESLFRMAPTFLLERFAKKNSNIVLKFKSQIISQINGLSDEQLEKLDLMLRTDIVELQAIMQKAYLKTKIRQYKILANPKYREFLEINLNELRKLI